MTNAIQTILNDLRGLDRVCGRLVAWRWLSALLLRLPQVLREKNLQAADAAVGEGPFEITYPSCSRFRVAGHGILSGIREMYARDCYLLGGLLRIQDGDLVVDLGANIGNFTNLALAHGPRERVVSVEPSKGLNERFTHSLQQNPGFADRTTLVRAFIGSLGSKQQAAIAADGDYRDAPSITEQELISLLGRTSIDFLKCDIEGGEFGLMTNKHLFMIAKQIAVEVHAFAGDVEAFKDQLEKMGFHILRDKQAPDGTSIILACRSAGALT